MIGSNNAFSYVTVKKCISPWKEDDGDPKYFTPSELRVDLEKQLTLLRKLGLVTDWHSCKVGVGRERVREIETHWNAAQIILLLVSAHFIASDSYDIAKRAMERHEVGTAHVIPVSYDQLIGKVHHLKGSKSYPQIRDL